MREALNPTLPLFGPRASFTYYVRNGVLSIRDRNSGTSVTNDVQGVLADIGAAGVNLAGVKIIYCDSEGIWDGIDVQAGRFKKFYSINAESEASATAACLGHR